MAGGPGSSVGSGAALVATDGAADCATDGAAVGVPDEHAMTTMTTIAMNAQIDLFPIKRTSSTDFLANLALSWATTLHLWGPYLPRRWSTRSTGHEPVYQSPTPFPIAVGPRDSVPRSSSNARRAMNAAPRAPGSSPGAM